MQVGRGTLSWFGECEALVTFWNVSLLERQLLTTAFGDLLSVRVVLGGRAIGMSAAKGMNKLRW